MCVRENPGSAPVFDNLLHCDWNYMQCSLMWRLPKISLLIHYINTSGVANLLVLCVCVCVCVSCLSRGGGDINKLKFNSQTQFSITEYVRMRLCGGSELCAFFFFLTKECYLLQYFGASSNMFVGTFWYLVGSFVQKYSGEIISRGRGEINYTLHPTPLDTLLSDVDTEQVLFNTVSNIFIDPYVWWHWRRYDECDEDKRTLSSIFSSFISRLTWD